MKKNDKKLSEILIKIGKIGLKNQKYLHHEVFHILMFLAHVAWNRVLSNGEYQRNGEYCSFIEELKIKEKVLKKALIAIDWEVIIEEMVKYKMEYYPKDNRFITLISYTERKTLRVEWKYKNKA